MFNGTQIMRRFRKRRVGPPAFLRSQRGLVALLGLLVLVGPAVSDADPSVAKEYQLKAAFLYNFTKFVEWPSQRFADETSPIVIGVLGRNPFGDELEKIVQGRKINGRTVAVRLLNSAAEARAVHVLFVSAGAEPQLADAMDALRTAGVLTVGESDKFMALGGVITFALETGKVRFEINQDAGENAGLKISAQLLKLATAVHRKT
jgi:hypothetical protein